MRIPLSLQTAVDEWGLHDCDDLRFPYLGKVYHVHLHVPVSQSAVVRVVVRVDSSSESE